MIYAFNLKICYNNKNIVSYLLFKINEERKKKLNIIVELEIVYSLSKKDNKTINIQIDIFLFPFLIIQY